MPHHSSKLADKFGKLADKFGPTGLYPEGKLTEHDEGEIAFGVTAHKGKVIINFGAPVAWLGMSPDQARELAASLREQARKIDGKPKRRRSGRK